MLESWSPQRTAGCVGLACAVAVGSAASVGVLVPSTGSAGPALLVLAALVGLPHGAVDHLALGWARDEHGRAGAPLLVAYAAGAVLAALVALSAPVPAVLVLLALSAAHFAEGEVAFDRLRGGPGLGWPAAALGAAVVALPVALRPEPVRPLLVALDPALPGVLADLRTPVLLGTALLVTIGLVVGGRSRDWRSTGELAVVVVAALLAPPLLVFAAWFGLWHAPRHLVRMLALQPTGDLRTRLGRLARGALVPTAVALVGLAALVFLGRGVPTAVLIGLLALTVPHAAVVARLAQVAPAVRCAARDRRGRSHVPASGSERRTRSAAR